MKPKILESAPAGDGIIVKDGNWTFDGIVPEVFDQHISKSIPGYAQGHQSLLELARPVLEEGGLCYELGCSTGALTARLAACTDPAKAKIIGLDQIDTMLDGARSLCSKFPHVAFEQANIVDYPFSPARVVVSYYTLQFIPIAQRIKLVQQIFSALVAGGLFLLFEKTHCQDALRNEQQILAYHAFKRDQGFSEEEILTKAAALEGVLIPQTEEENIAMLRTAGFSGVNRVFDELGFQGYIAAKPL